jgi:hypothetical protein
VRALDAEKIEKLASYLTILDQGEDGVSEGFVPFELNDEQRQIVALILENEFALIGKGRQVGASTACLLVLLAFVVANAGVPAAVVVDTQSKAKKLLAKVSGWAHELGIETPTDNVLTLRLANGSSIEAISAISPSEGESKVGRSGSYGFVLLSEAAFYGPHDEAIFAAVTSTMLAGGKVVAESTGHPSENLFRKLWESEGWAKLFLSVQTHRSYRRDPAHLTDEQWEHLRNEHGFTDRAAASWWHHKLTTAFGGNVRRCLREYPVIWSHMFATAAGRYITQCTVAPILRQEGPWTFYKTDHRPDERVIIGVDTGAGGGADASALAIISHRTGQLVSTFRDNTIRIPAYVDLIRKTVASHKVRALVVECNGLGVGVEQGLANENVWLVRQHSSEGEKEKRLQELTSAIETGALPIATDLAFEIQHAVIQKKVRPSGQTVFVRTGPDDLLNALSFARKHLAEDPYRAPNPDDWGYRDLSRLRPVARRPKAARY